MRSNAYRISVFFLVLSLLAQGWSANYGYGVIGALDTYGRN